MSDDALEVVALELLLEASVAIEQTLDHPDLTPLKAVLARAREEAASAIRTLITIDPTQVTEIRRLQNEARRYESLVSWLRGIMTEGREAAAQLNSMYHDRAEEFRAQVFGETEDDQNGAQD